MSYRPTRLFKGAANRDDNEPKFIELLDAYHIEYSQGKPGDGYDLLVQIQPMELWEIKNGQRPPSARKLTDAEKRKQTYCEARGISYRVFEHVEDAEKYLFNHNKNTTLINKCSAFDRKDNPDERSNV